MENEVLELALIDPFPDVHGLFCHYNELYFKNSLGACSVEWSSCRMTLCAGICCYIPGGGCRIKLSEPILKFRPISDLKNTLLHEMIHAYLFLTVKNRDREDHGSMFQSLMQSINKSKAPDFQRPEEGYALTIYHSFHDEVDNYRKHHWQCFRCNKLVKRAMNRTPSNSDCRFGNKFKFNNFKNSADVSKVNGFQTLPRQIVNDSSCNDSRCFWHTHEKHCGGSFIKISEPEGYCDRRKKIKTDFKGGKNDDLTFISESKPCNEQKNIKQISSNQKQKQIQNQNQTNDLKVLKSKKETKKEDAKKSDRSLKDFLKLEKGHVLAEEKHVWAEKKQVWADEKHVWAEERHLLAEKRHLLAEEKHVFAEEKQVLAEKACAEFKNTIASLESGSNGFSKLTCCVCGKLFEESISNLEMNAHIDLCLNTDKLASFD